MMQACQHAAWCPVIEQHSNQAAAAELAQQGWWCQGRCVCVSFRWAWLCIQCIADYMAATTVHNASISWGQ